MIDQMNKAAFESAANIYNGEIVAAHPHAAAHTRDSLFDIGKPEIMEFQFVPFRKRALEDANVSVAAERALQGRMFHVDPLTREFRLATACRL
jgi:hypothetical protein